MILRFEQWAVLYLGVFLLALSALELRVIDIVEGCRYLRESHVPKELGISADLKSGLTRGKAGRTRDT